MIDRSEVNSRQLVTRARKHLEASRPRFDADEAARDALLERFLAAAEEGDLEALEEMLAKDAVLYADGGGKAMAAPEPIYGARGDRALHGRRRARPAVVRHVREPARCTSTASPAACCAARGGEQFGESRRDARSQKAMAALKAGDVAAGEISAIDAG